MKTSIKEKYLGDYISESGSLQATIDDRIARAWSYLPAIKSFLKDVPLGSERIDLMLIANWFNAKRSNVLKWCAFQ